MGLEICVLGSGSSGNSTLIRSQQTTILIDAGFSCTELGRRLGSLDVKLTDVQGVCITHEHSDHVQGITTLQKKFETALYANSATVYGLRRNKKYADCHWTVFTTGSPFGIGDLAIEPFSVPHDAEDPVGFLVSNNGIHVGIITDAGIPTALIRSRLRHCHAIVLEANHDEQMLHDTERPWFLKQRILGRQGHMSNHQAADILEEIAGPHLEQVYLAHLSEDCNCPDLAITTLRRRLDKAGHSHVQLSLTHADRPSKRWMKLSTMIEESSRGCEESILRDSGYL